MCRESLVSSGFFSGVVYIGGGWGLLPVVVCVEHDDGVICGGFITGDDFFDTFLCVGGRIFCALLCAVHALAASVSGGLIPADMGAGVPRIILSLQAKVLLMTARLAETVL